MRLPSSLSSTAVASLAALPILCFSPKANSAVTPAAAPAVTPEQRDFFENKIRPIFADHCMECHSGEKGKTKGSFSMDSREEILKGGETGPSIIPGNAKGSTMIKAVTWEDDLQMPPKKKLSAEQIENLQKWVTMGAPDPRDPSKLAKADKKAHWAFQPVVKPTPPTVKNAAWCVNKVDNFILAKLEEKQMLPAPQAEKETLLRRAYYDLIGLPPTPKDIEDFIREATVNQDQAYAKVIERLLADPAYGERWGRHWLDTARYSDTTGDLNQERVKDYRYPFAWTYREWVIKALNSDLPYDQFIMQQLAADKLPNNPKENLAALGLLTVGQRFDTKDDIINDRIDVIGRGFLGLTLACARCHDHKFDPVTAADYYALRGVFASTVEPKEGPLIAGDPHSPTFIKYQEELAKLEEKAYAAFYKLQRDYNDKLMKHGEAIFEAAVLTKKGSTQEQVAKGNEILKKAGLDKDKDVLFNGAVMTTAKLRPNDEIYGPFFRLFNTTDDTRAALIESTLNGKDKAKFNPEVIAFLKEQKAPLPSDLHEVAVLVGKFFQKMEPRVAGLYATFTDKTKDISNSPDLAAMKVAVFPLRLTPASELDIPRLMEEGNTGGYNTRMQGILKDTANLAGINKFKVTFKGGPVRAMTLEDSATPMDSPLYVRGNAPKPGEKVRTVPRRFVEVLSMNGEPVPFKEGSGRLELAQSIASKTNPLTARVIVNRVWMHHFGDGLVRTPDDLGNQAGKPTHPELLDFLANWFMEDFGAAKPGWSLKNLHKAIMLSRAYQQSSNTAFKAGSGGYEKVDPANTMLWRANVRRLDFEGFRDSLISMAGIMDRTLGGQSFNVTDEPYSFRRSVYAYIDRASMPDLLMQFDMANPDAPNSRRTSTIVPQQALFLMNSSFVAEIVQNVVHRPEIVQAVREGSDRGINAVYRVVLQRLPTPNERQRAMAFLLKENKEQASVKADAQKINQEATKLAEKKAKAAQNSKLNTAAIQNEGEMVQRVAFSPWETLVQALLFSNEAAYVN